MFERHTFAEVNKVAEVMVPLYHALNRAIEARIYTKTRSARKSMIEHAQYLAKQVSAKESEYYEQGFTVIPVHDTYTGIVYKIFICTDHSNKEYLTYEI